MSNKKLFTPKEAALSILEDLPSDFSEEIESSDSEDDFVPDVLRLAEPIPIENESENDNYTESSSEEDVEADIDLNAAVTMDQVLDTNMIDADSNNSVVEDADISIDRNDYDVDQDRHWTKKTKKQIETPFTSPEGPIKDHFTDCQNPCDYFFSYFDKEIQQNILYQTNLYITQCMKTVPNVSLRELLSFLGINIIMGYHELPSWTDYWSCDPDLSVPFASSALPRNRFAQILSNIHVNDNATVPNNNTDKLYKLRPLINQLNSNFVKLYNVSQRVSIDESMILFKGRSSLKQYNPMKPIKRGFKLWAIADMDGYLYQCQVYQGKNQLQTDNSMPKYFGLGASVVYQLTKSLHGKHHQVYCDNYFTSVPLMEYLLQHQVYCCGTIRSDRKYLPKNLKSDKVLLRGDFDYRVSTGGLVFYKWKDSKSVTMLSNFHGTEPATVLRTQKDGTRKDFNCPVSIKDYNIFMGGVDKADQLISSYGLSRKSKKWWHRIFFGLIERALCNSFIAFNKITGAKMKSLLFRRMVAQSLITRGRPPRVGRPLSSATQQGASKKRKSLSYSVSSAIRKENLGVHWPIYDKKRGRCEVCAQDKQEARPHIKCTACEAYLCLNDKKNCFAKFHE